MSHVMNTIFSVLLGSTDGDPGRKQCVDNFWNEMADVCAQFWFNLSVSSLAVSLVMRCTLNQFNLDNFTNWKSFDDDDQKWGQPIIAPASTAPVVYLKSTIYYMRERHLLCLASNVERI
jgi:hypothetical protein